VIPDYLKDNRMIEFVLPDGGRAIEIDTVPINWNVTPREFTNCSIDLSVGNRVLITQKIPWQEAAAITHATLFRITDALGYDYAFLGAFGRRK